MSSSDRLEAIRDIFDTVGRRGKPGERIRCIVSVGMLTEGWDARNVTHIFGYRRFGSLLLCEQVTGRALRRTSFSGHDNVQSPEYANVFGVPYMFARGEDETIQVPVQPYLVESLPERASHRMNLPNVVGYDYPGDTVRFRLDASKVEPYVVVRSAPSETQLQGAVGSEDRTVAYRRYRTAIWETAAAVARHVDFASATGDSHIRKRIAFADAVSATKSWLEHPNISCDFPEELQFDDAVPAKIAKACIFHTDDQSGPLPIFADMRDRGLPRLLSTGDVRFETTLQHRYDTTHSELNAAACHSHSEVQLAGILDGHRLVQCWVRNFRLGFAVPWFDAETDMWRVTEPDFVACVARPNSAIPLHLLIEFKGKRRGDSREEQKRIYLEKWWAPAVSAWGEYGEWRVVWIEDIRDAAQRLGEACAGEP